MPLKAIRCRSTERKMSSPQNIARAPARARARLLGHKLNHSRCGPERARRRCGGSAETPQSSTPPMVTPLANVSCLARRPVSASAACRPPPPRASPVGVHGRPPARIRPPKLAPAPSNAHEQPYPPTPQKKIRARAKAATKTRAPRPRALPTCMWPFKPRGLPAPRKRLDAGAMHMPQQHLHCKNLLQNGGSVSVACARGPLLREDACAILRVSVTRIAVCRLLVSALRAARPNRTTARRGRWACAWRGRNGSRGCRYGCQVRLLGTALRYGS